MTLQELKKLCNEIPGVNKTRISRLKSYEYAGIFITFKPVPVIGNPRHVFTTFVSLDGWEFSLEIAHEEYGRLFKKAA